MDNLVLMLSVFAGFLVVIVYALLWALLKSNSRIIETNKQLIILAAGKDAKPEALRALVATNKPPQGKLRGIAPTKKETKKSGNVDYEMQIGVR